jgi:glycosyltransferase involved in cell wall biosynthesis
MISVGFALRNFSGLTGVSRYVAGLAERLPSHGFLPLLAAHRWPGAGCPTALKEERIPMLSLTSWTRAAGFDLLARRRLRRLGARLVHGQGDLTRQDVLTVNNCDAAAALYVPDGRRPSPGVDYIRRRQFSPEGSRVIIANSDMVRGDVSRFYGVPPEKIRRIYFGVDAERFPAERRPEARRNLLAQAGWPAETEIVLCVLSGDPAKRNFSLLTQALENLAAKRPAALCLVGNAPWEKDAAARRLRERGKLFHAPPTPRVEDFFTAADVLALPAHYEEFGLTVLEALAAGCPAVVSRRCGAAEILTDGTDGRVFDDLQDPGELEDALARVLEERPAPEACRRTAENYSWDRHMEQIAAVYKELL